MKSDKNPKKTLWEIVKWTLISHPTLAPHVEKLALKIQGKNDSNKLEKLFRLTNSNSKIHLDNLKKTKSQILQDMFVLSYLKYKRNGYFVEFGATNGVDISNTYLMEKEFGWSGILAEPAKCWHEKLKSNRSCHIETDCVWTHTGKILNFNETEMAELATISEYSENDYLKESRRNGTTYKVNTISLFDMLVKYDAPKKIDYLSIDTEGSEYEILRNFDFSEYKFEVITCEHNYTELRENIRTLLSKNGYKRVFDDISSVDDWYVNITTDIH
jgi:FkbM family methyltransferase